MSNKQRTLRIFPLVLAFLFSGVGSSVIAKQSVAPALVANLPSLIAYYPFDGNLNDLSGNNYNGTTSGVIPFVSGAVGQAISLDRSAWMQVNIPQLPVGQAARSLCLRAKSATGHHSGNSDHLANWGTASDGQAFGLMIFNSDTWWGYGHNYQLYDTDSSVPTDTNWHFLCVTYDGAKMRVYVDAALRGERTMTLNTVGTIFYVGVRPDRTTDNLYEGLIDELRIYNTALSDSQIQSLSEQGITRRPLVFIPGIMGSYLDVNVPLIGSCNIWPGIPRLNCPTLPPKELLALPSTVVVPTDAIRDIPQIGKIYQPLLSKLTTPINQGGGGFVEYPTAGSTKTPLQRCEQVRAEKRTDVTLFTFAYDWRQDNRVSASQLHELINCIRALHPGQKIDIVTHSMGGLIARRYILDYPGTHDINKLITIAAPWLGAPKAVAVMESGWFTPQINLLFSLTSGGVPGRDIIALITRRFEGVQQLLPSAAYIDTFKQHPLKEDGRDINKNGYRFDEYNATQFRDWLNTSYPNMPGDHNADLHTSDQDDWQADQSGVKYVHFYGRTGKQDTVKTMRSIWWVGCASQKVGQIACVPFTGYDLDWTNGDGTVPEVSANRVVGSTNLNAPTIQPMPITGGNTEHTALASNQFVIDGVIAQLNSVGQTQPTMTRQADLPPTPAYYLNIIGSAHITIADTFGNTIDTISGTLTTPIPDVTYTPLTDVQHVAVLQATQSYTVTFGSGMTPLLVTVSRGTSNTADQATRFLDLNLPANSLLQLHITPQGIAPLRADTDGNGSFETEIAPTVSLTGPAANDIAPPTITVNHTGTLNQMTVTLLATDAGSGVKQLLYSLDGTTFQPYTTPFTVDATKTPILYAFADDNAANRSGLLAEPLAYQLYLPLNMH